MSINLTNKIKKHYERNLQTIIYSNTFQLKQYDLKFSNSNEIDLSSKTSIAPLKYFCSIYLKNGAKSKVLFTLFNFITKSSLFIFLYCIPVKDLFVVLFMRNLSSFQISHDWIFAESKGNNCLNFTSQKPKEL